MVNKSIPTLANRDAAGQPISEYKDAPEVYKTQNPSYVDKVLVTATEDDTFLTKILLRQTRRPEIGDKFSSRHGQKGVIGRCFVLFNVVPNWLWYYSPLFQIWK